MCEGMIGMRGLTGRSSIHTGKKAEHTVRMLGSE